ncbi:hypothetical protein HDU96_008484, partial [Phlyctochytrium bullatum]
LELLSLCLGDSPDKAFTIDIDGTATVSRLRSTVATCTRQVPLDLNLFAVKPGAGLLINDSRIAAFLATAGWDGSSGVLRADPVTVETRLPVVWLKDPTDSVADACLGDGRDSLLEPALRAKQLRLLVVLDGRLQLDVPGVAGSSALPPPAYVGPDAAGLPSARPAEVGAPGFMLAGVGAGVPVQKARYDAPAEKSKFDFSGSEKRPGAARESVQGSAVSGPLFGTAHLDAVEEKRLLAANSSTAGMYLHEPVPVMIPSTTTPYFTPSTSSDPVLTPQLQANALPYSAPAAPAKFPNEQQTYGGAGAAGADAAAWAAKTEEEERRQKSKRTVVIAVVVAVAVVVLVTVGAAVGVLLSRKNGDSGNNTLSPISSSVPVATGSLSSSSAGSTSVGTATGSVAGQASQTSQTSTTTSDVTFNNDSPAMVPNPLTNTTLFASNGNGSIIEIAINGSSRREFASANTVSHGMVITGTTLVSADNTSLSFFDISGGTGQQTQSLTDYLGTGRSPTAYEVRDITTGPTTADGVAVLANEAYLGPTTPAGVVVFVDTTRSNALSYLAFPAGTEGYPWAVSWAASNRFLVGMSTGLVYEYTRSGASAAWTRRSQFRAHTSDVRTMEIVAGQRYLVSGGFDGSVRVWDLDALPVTTGSGSAVETSAVETSVAEYSGLGQVYEMAIKADETEIIMGGSSKTAFVYPLPQRGRSIATNVQVWSRVVNYDVYHFVYYNQNGATGWLVAGNTQSPVVISN